MIPAPLRKKGWLKGLELECIEDVKTGRMVKRRGLTKTQDPAPQNHHHHY